ncbi:MAG: J domain-containing protein [Bacteroidales bacterium]|nr:J domain-containing protein [Bacteroidales bacterium]
MNGCSSYYDVLGIAPGSNLRQIKKAFHEKAKLYHPDINHNPFAQDHFIQIREAFDRILRQRQKGLYPMHAASASSGIHGYQSFGYRSRKRNQKYYSRPKNPDFTESRQGKIIYCTVHIIFILTGFLIFINPLIMTLQHQFDPGRPLYDSLTAALVTMFFGIVMIMAIGLSLVSFIRKA